MYERLGEDGGIVLVYEAVEDVLWRSVGSLPRHRAEKMMAPTIYFHDLLTQ